MHLAAKKAGLVAPRGGHLVRGCDWHAVPAAPAPLTPKLGVHRHARWRGDAVWRKPEVPWATCAPFRWWSPGSRCHFGNVGLGVLHVDDHNQRIHVSVILVLAGILMDEEIRPEPKSTEVLVVGLDGRNALGHAVKLRLEL